MAMRKHCTMSELIALKDGEGTAWVRTHVEACSFCQRELELLHGRVAAMRALPTQRPPRDRWSVIREQALKEQRGLRFRRTTWGALALAASLTIIVGIRTVDLPGGQRVVATPELTELMERSRELEAALRDYGTEGRVLNTRAAGIIADLEYGIEVVDAGIAEAGSRGTQNELLTLWRDRVNLMDALVNAHVTRAAYVGF